MQEPSVQGFVANTPFRGATRRARTQSLLTAWPTIAPSCPSPFQLALYTTPNSPSPADGRSEGRATLITNPQRGALPWPFTRPCSDCKGFPVPLPLLLPLLLWHGLTAWASVAAPSAGAAGRRPQRQPHRARAHRQSDPSWRPLAVRHGPDIDAAGQLPSAGPRPGARPPDRPPPPLPAAVVQNQGPREVAAPHGLRQAALPCPVSQLNAFLPPPSA